MLYVRIMHPGTLYVRYQGVFGNAASTMSCICPGGKWLLRYVRGVGNGMALCTLYGDRYALRESYGRLVSLLTLRRNRSRVVILLLISHDHIIDTCIMVVY